MLAYMPSLLKRWRLKEQSRVKANTCEQCKRLYFRYIYCSITLQPRVTKLVRASCLSCADPSFILYSEANESRNSMHKQLGQNIATLRKLKNVSQEELANEIGVSRQAVAKWETGATSPDISNCLALAQYFEVTLDNLVNYESQTSQTVFPPKGKHLFGIATIGERGQIVLPKEARDIFCLKAGDKLVVLGDEERGIALMKADALTTFYDEMNKAIASDSDKS